MTQESESRRPTEERQSPLDLTAFVPYACIQLQASFLVRIKIRIQEEYVSKTEDHVKKSGKKKPSFVSTMSVASIGASQSFPENGYDNPRAASSDLSVQMDEVVMTAVYDTLGRLVEVKFDRCKEVPRMLAQVLALSVPFQQLLTKFTVRWSGVGGETLYEIAKLIRLSMITEVCFDDSPVPAKNYYLLLEYRQIRRLSIARCHIDDNDCAVLASKLVYPLPASKNLNLLCLASNMITDKGAIALADALRSNRSLLYLNLADNKVTDAGGVCLFRTLAEFPLTFDEILAKRMRYIQYLQERKVVYERCVGELSALQERTVEQSHTARRKTIGDKTTGNHSIGMSPNYSIGMSPSIPKDTYGVMSRAEVKTNEIVGIFTDPFEPSQTVLREGYLHCLGNTTLCFLNLSYNELGLESVVALRNTLECQTAVGRRPGSGLLRVSLEGNPLPDHCDHYEPIQSMLSCSLQPMNRKQSKKLDRKSKTTHSERRNSRIVQAIN